MLTLNVQEHDFLPVAVVVLGSDDVLSSVVQLDSVDDEVIVIVAVSFHKLDTLLELLVIVVPG